MNRPRVLIVEDHETVSTLMSIYLHGLHGINVLCAHDVHTALATFSEFRPDRVVADVMLPDGSGIEMIRVMKSKRPGIRAIVTTGLDDPDVKDAAADAGAAEFLVKPVTTADLMKSLDIPERHEPWDDESRVEGFNP